MTDSLIHWARGALWADPVYRRDERLVSIRDLLFKESLDNINFWRGLIDGCCGIALYRSNTRVKSILQPRVNVFASAPMLKAIVEWTYLRTPGFDTRATLAKHCNRGRLEIQGNLAQNFVEIYWPNDNVVTFETNRRAARDVRGWLTRGGTKSRDLRTSNFIDRQLLKGVDIVQKRVPWEHYLSGSE